MERGHGTFGFGREYPDPDRRINLDMDLIKTWLPQVKGEFGRENREGQIFECAKALRLQYKKVGAAGYCYGGWAVFRLGAKGQNLVDCIHTSHPTWLTKDDIDNVSVPVQSIPYDYQYFPGVDYGFGARGSMKKEGERAAVTRNKNATVYWSKTWLHPG